MKLPLSILTGFGLLMFMFYAMVGLNGLSIDTYRAWHYYTEVISHLEMTGESENGKKEMIQNAREKGYEIRIEKVGEASLVTLYYRVSVPVFDVSVKQRISGYAF